MFTEKELVRGAKRVLLEYIRDNGIPISKILTDEEINQSRDEHVNVLELIVRGDNACQIQGFSGIFPSYSTKFPQIGFRSKEDIKVLATELTLGQLISIVTLNRDGSITEEDELGLLSEIAAQKKEIEYYCDRLGITDVPTEILPLVQELHGHSDNLFQHPHNPNKVIISQQRAPGSPEEYTVVYDREKNEFLYILNDELWQAVDKNFKPSPENERYMRKAIETYDRIVALEKFAKGKAKDWTYEMEFGRHRETDELLVYQFRKFRKKETADFKLEDLEIGKDSLRFNLAFGITPKEGIELIYRPSIPAKKGEDLSGNITRIIPMGTPEATYPHVALPGIKGIFYIDFKYSHNHGAREALMQVPFVLCDCTGVYVPSSFDQLNVLIPQLEEYAKLNVKLSSREVAKGAKLRLYSDGITGVIEFVEYAKIPA